MRSALPFVLALVAGCSSTVQGTASRPGNGDAGDPALDGGALTDARDAADAGSDEIPPHHSGPIEKLDLLFMIDNSSSMAEKQQFLRQSIPELLTRLAPVAKDLHVGIVSSSLGGRTSDQCAASPNPNNPALDSHNDDRGRLVDRAGPDEHHAAGGSFLAWAPGATTDTNPLLSAFQDMIVGVGEHGCGFEAQLESWYHFLVQPDPYLAIERTAETLIHLAGVDDTILKQRHDFLRPDSMVGIIVFTDENDSTVDPLANEGQGWAWESSSFPGSPTGSAPRATTACATHPMDPSCMSCALGGSSIDTSCAAGGGYYELPDDRLNVRFFHMKQRFGTDPQFPIERYVNGLSAAKVPDREGEHLGGAGPYLGRANCINPLFAASLPASSGEELCALPRGPRALDMVWLAVIGGVPNQLLHFDPLSAQASKLTAENWKQMLGADPLHYDFTGVDPHMRESILPRAELSPPSSPDDADPIHGREWDTQGNDLQYACTFALPAAIDCTSQANRSSCDCNQGNAPPLCDPAKPTQQIRGKAYPTVRELALVRALGDRGIAGSICPIHSVEQGPGDPLFGYRPTMKTIFDHVVDVIAH